MNNSQNHGSERLDSSDNSRLRQAPDGDSHAGNNGNGSLDATHREILHACSEYLRDAQAWRRQVTATLENLTRITMANTEALTPFEALHREYSSTAAQQRANAAQVESQLGQLARGSAAQNHNLEQMRLQIDGLARSFEKLSQEVIERQVMDPLFVRLARLYEAVYALSGRPPLGDDHLLPIRQRIRDVLEDYNVELIHPDDGERMDPRRHHPVDQLTTADASQHGRVAGTFNVGLIQGQRLIQPARIEVFIFADNTSATKTNT